VLKDGANRSFDTTAAAASVMRRRQRSFRGAPSPLRDEGLFAGAQATLERRGDYRFECLFVADSGKPAHADLKQSLPHNATSAASDSEVGFVLKMRRLLPYTL
jgi:hypothetical protein